MTLDEDIDKAVAETYYSKPAYTDPVRATLCLEEGFLNLKVDWAHPTKYLINPWKDTHTTQTYSQDVTTTVIQVGSTVFEKGTPEKFPLELEKILLRKILYDAMSHLLRRNGLRELDPEAEWSRASPVPIDSSDFNVVVVNTKRLQQTVSITYTLPGDTKPFVVSTFNALSRDYIEAVRRICLPE